MASQHAVQGVQIEIVVIVLVIIYRRLFLSLTAQHPRILADQLTLFKPGGQIMTPTLLIGTRGYKILTQALIYIEWLHFRVTHSCQPLGSLKISTKSTQPICYLYCKEAKQHKEYQSMRQRGTILCLQIMVPVIVWPTSFFAIWQK